MSNEASIDDVLQHMRRSQYKDLAEVVEHYVEHDESQFGPHYKPTEAPHQDRINPWYVMWAFRAGRAMEND